MNTSPNILLVEDSDPEAILYNAFLESEEATVTHVSTGESAMQILKTNQTDLMVLDLNLPDMTGLDVLQHLRERRAQVPTIMMTGQGSVNAAVGSMQAGASDFIVKPFDGRRLVNAVRDVLSRTRTDLPTVPGIPPRTVLPVQDSAFIGSSSAMMAVNKTLDAAAKSDVTVFVTGESGTGKEVCAEALHARSSRAGAAFVAINCAAIPHNLMEAEVFGHVKGAFTGATSDREGAAMRADGGTLFLDEICEMNLDLQAKLLRFVQSGVVQRVGETKTRKVDVRIVCATNLDPWEEVQAGRFREDLYYRLHVVPVSLPPLRARGGDVLELARAMLVRFAKEEEKDIDGFDAPVERALRLYDWPGNVRQLQNVIRTMVVFCNDCRITTDMLPSDIRGGASESHLPVPGPSNALGDPREMTSPGRKADLGSTGIEPLRIVERRAIERAIGICGGNIPRAAAFLEISASTIYRKKLAWDGSQAAHE